MFALLWHYQQQAPQAHADLRDAQAIITGAKLKDLFFRSDY